MNCEVQHLDKNMRYRILIINGEHYILDMERSFWKIIFPFLFWMLPSTVFKVDDPDIVKQLKTEVKEKSAGSLAVSLGGIAYAIGILLAPIMGYFEIEISLLVNSILLILALILLAFLYFSISNKRKKKLESIIKLETLPKNVLRIRPNSTNLVFKLVAAYTFLLGFVLFLFSGFIYSRNIMLLIIASGLLFLLLLSNRVTVDQGHITVRFTDYEKVI
ncbi:DUF443 family protein [Oceanobacillus kimchii]|uniref:DUF443 family protein n=1 Tax=Oceanobacillus kimchii TaxID=746691 RepID=A0ABQ5THM7_9BACI|nr:DUF443 family protein [Oceanobacillus kimchii]GLO65776.1 hypothetical protein MACH08_15600 [Oceanobacillus kimchii]